MENPNRGRINILSRHTADRIAAGEVVERPYSVIKELVENSIDAGATSIVIETQGGGREYMRVTDNGGGILAEDVEVAFRRHTTSKISDGDDLAHIGTLGFRGEALSSISAVAKVTLRTKPAAQESGAQLCIEGGEILRHAPDGCPDGTTIEVSELFYNTPARQKFLKTPGTEAAQITDYVGRMILSHPHIAFKLLQNGKTVFQSPGDGKLESAVFCVYGADVLSHMEKIDYFDGALTLTGYAGTERLARPTRVQQSFFVNSRYIKSQKLSFAVQRAYDTRLMSGKFPFIVLNIALPVEEVDVNVHPTKLEVRFRDEKRVLHAVTTAVRLALSKSSFSVPKVEKDDIFGHLAEKPSFPSFPITSDRLPVESANISGILNTQRPAEGQRLGEARHALDTAAFLPTSVYPPRPGTNTVVTGKSENAANVRPARAFENTGETAATPPPVSSISEQTPELAMEAEKGEQLSTGGAFSIVGQLFECYWVVQQGQTVFFIDQHAAHERSLYERMTQAEADKGVISQLLLTPIIARLEPLTYATLMDNLAEFSALGFDISEFGTLTVSIRAIPYIMGEPQTLEYLQEAIALLQKTGKRPMAAELKKEALMQAACKHAVKSGMRLSEKEIEALLYEYASSGTPMTCPHGRPVMVRMSRTEFEKLFKRIV